MPMVLMETRNSYKFRALSVGGTLRCCLRGLNCTTTHWLGIARGGFRYIIVLAEMNRLADRLWQMESAQKMAIFG